MKKILSKHRHDFQAKGASRRTPYSRKHLGFEPLEPRLTLSVNVLTFHNDIASTGLNPSETLLTPANVAVGTFGKLFATALDGQVYAQPLVDTGVTIATGPNTTANSAGLHDVVFVATEHDTVYAIDTNPASNGKVLWKRSFTDITTPGYSGSTPGTNINDTLGASTINSVPYTAVSTTDITPEIGITGTPVIDPSTNTMYLVTKTEEVINSVWHYVQRLHAIRLDNGTDAAIPYLIGNTDTRNGFTISTQIYSYGTGDGSVIDPYNGTGRRVVQFNAITEHQRGALNLVNNKVYVEWASHGDNGPYHGWVVAWDVANLTTTGFVLSGVFNTSPNDGLSGIWQGGGRLAFEADGSAFYFETGNGSGGAPTLNANGFPIDGNYNEALVKVVADPTTTPTNQNINGWGLKAADYFMPYNVVALDGADSDFGSGAPMILPDSAGIPGHPHLMVASGKEGKIYLIDRDNMGKFDPNNDHVLNAVPDGSGHNTPPVQLVGSLSTPAYFNGKIYWTSGYNGGAYAYTINSNGTLSVASNTTATFGYLPGSVDISSNGTLNGIAWVMDRNANRIHAYSAATFATEFWHSDQKVGGGDSVGAVIKFAVPTIANGEVFVGTSNSLVVYGLTQPPTAVPNQPTLSATALSGTSIKLTWTDTSVSPNTATGYSIEKSTDGTNFSVATTAPAGATSISLGGLQPSTLYYFRIRGFNGIGNSPYSAVANATTTSTVVGLDFSAGFTGATSKLTFNGSTALNGSKLELTNGGGNQAASAFSTTALDITEFNTQFTFQLSAGASTADGFTFCIQGVGPTALGASGGDLGYTGIGQSVAVKFDLYDNQGEGVNSTGIYTNGAPPNNVGSINLTGTGIDLHSGDAIQVTMSYDGTTLSVTMHDPVAGKTATQNYLIDIPGTVGGGTAYVGFTAGTGGLTATQDILNWTFTPITATVSPNAPSGLGGSAASATSIALNWTNNATNQTGFHLDRATDAAFTQNLITENLPATPDTFTDTALGLAPGGTYYYRLRAYNSAGDSDNSNSVSVTIPVAPPKPTDQQITDVLMNEIDMSWQDNAGHQADGYKILRAANHGFFTQIATLPLTSRTPPSTYTWADTTVTPGTYYEYHIVAYNVSGNNDFAGVNATTLTLPPDNLIATGSTNSIDLSWTAPTGAASYNVYRSTTPGGEGGIPLASGVLTTTFSDTTALSGTTYYYVVTALNGNIAPLPSESGFSTEGTAGAMNVLPSDLPLAGAVNLSLSIGLDGLLHVYQTVGSTNTDVLPPRQLSSVSQVNITGRDNLEEALTIVFDGGNPLPPSGLTFNGGTGGGNTIVVSGTSGNDSVTMTTSQINVNAFSPINYNNVANFAFDLGTGSNSLLLDHVTLNLAQNNAISAGTDVTVDGGVLNFNNHSNNIGNLTVINGGQANVTAITNSSTTVTSGTLSATSIVTGSLSIGSPGATASTAAPASTTANRNPLLPSITQPIPHAPSIPLTPSIPSTVVKSSEPVKTDAAPAIPVFSQAISSPEITPTEKMSESTAGAFDNALPLLPSRFTAAAVNSFFNQSRSIDRHISSVAESLPEISMKTKKQSVTALTGNRAIHRHALRSIMTEFQRTIDQLDLEQLIGRNSRNYEKLSQKVVDDFHSQSIAES